MFKLCKRLKKNWVSPHAHIRGNFNETTGKITGATSYTAFVLPSAIFEPHLPTRYSLASSLFLSNGDAALRLILLSSDLSLSASPFPALYLPTLRGTNQSRSGL